MSNNGLQKGKHNESESKSSLSGDDEVAKSKLHDIDEEDLDDDDDYDDEEDEDDEEEEEDVR